MILRKKEDALIGDGENLLKQADSVGAAANADGIRRALRAHLLGITLDDSHLNALALGRRWLEVSLERKHAATPQEYARAAFAPTGLRASSPPAAILVKRDDLERMVACLKTIEAGEVPERTDVERALELFKVLNRSAMSEFTRLSASQSLAR